MTSLLALERLSVPAAALRHRHIGEARLLCRAINRSAGREKVIGTVNDCGVVTQLYGWAPQVETHADRTGFVYFVPLVLPRGGSLVYAGEIGEFASATLLLERGRVYRLWDHARHGTYESGPVVCLFRGPYPQPDDADAITAFRAAISLLERGDDEAARVSAGFRKPLHDECYALVDGYAKLLKTRAARAQKLVVATCAMCRRTAFKVDSAFPYFWDGNRCRKHLTMDAKGDAAA